MKQLTYITILLSLLATGLLSASSLSAQSPFEFKDGELNRDFVDTLFARAAVSKDVDSTSLFLEKAVYLAEKIKYSEGVKVGYSQLVGLWRREGEVINELRIRLKWERYLKDRGFNASLAENYLEVGNLYFENEIYSKAGDAYKNSMEMSESYGFKTAYPALKKLAWTRHLQIEFAEAKSLYKKGITEARKRGSKEDELWMLQQTAEIAHLERKYQEEVSINQQILDLTKNETASESRMIAMNNLGYAYKYLGDTERSALYFEQVLTVIPKKKFKTMKAGVLQNLGIIYQNQQRFDEAIEKFTEAIFIYNDEKNKAAEATAKDFIALIYYQKNDPWNAILYNKQAISMASKNELYGVLQSAYQTKSLIHQSLYEYEEALEAYKVHLALKDSLTVSDKSLRQEINRQKDDLKRMDNELKLRWISDDLKEQEIARLSAEKEAEEVKRKKEIALKDAALREEAERSKKLAALRDYERVENLRLIAEGEKRAAEYEKERLAELANKRKLQAEADSLAAVASAKEAEAANEAAEKAGLKLEVQKSKTQRLLLGLGALGLLILVILGALAQLRKKNKIIEEEKEHSDNLLHNILPASVAAELKATNKTTPRSYTNTSIVFTDFSGFTQISEKLTPEELVHTLDNIFGRFDEIVERNGLTRIKTIGDAYMCACGLPDEDRNHAQKAVDAAIDMRDFILKFNADLPKDAPKWNIRIGVNSGQVVAGVVGIKKFAYDIWGDTVNLAARMESSGQIGKVNISEDTYKIVKHNFETEPRGKVKAKNKGEIDMYFVERRA